MGWGGFGFGGEFGFWGFGWWCRVDGLAGAPGDPGLALGLPVDFGEEAVADFPCGIGVGVHGEDDVLGDVVGGVVAQFEVEGGAGVVEVDDGVQVADEAGGGAEGGGIAVGPDGEAEGVLPGDDAGGCLFDEVEGFAEGWGGGVWEASVGWIRGALSGGAEACVDLLRGCHRGVGSSVAAAASQARMSFWS